MTRWSVVAGCFAAALLCGLAFWAITDATVVPMVARGAGPGGVQVTSGGWLALMLSALGTGGFTLAGLISAIANRFGLHVPGDSADTLISEVAELTASFAALMNSRSNRAAQRRFFFALVDAARLINGCETSHDGGIVVIKYSGYADPAPSAQAEGGQ